eukprot:XP_001695100.1 predicted protein [Chlamydomonas reinhardtii]
MSKGQGSPRPIIIQPGVTLSLVNLTLRLPPLLASLAAAPVSLLQHVPHRLRGVSACSAMGLQPMTQLPHEVNGTPELQAFARVLCRPTGTNLRFYPSNVMAIVNGVLRTAAAALLNNTAEVVVISVTGNVSINASVWRGALALPRGLVLSLLGNPTAGQGVQIDFGGVAPAFTASSYGSSGAVRLRDLNLVGLPYSRTVNSPMDFFSPWLHPFRVFRGGSGGATSTPQLIATSCVLWLPDQEASWWNTALLAASSVNALEARPWLARLFTLPVTASSSSSSTSGGVRGTRVTSLNDAGGVARFTDCTFASLYDSPANAPRSEFATIAWWPLMEGVPAAVSYQAALGEYAVINSSLAAASIGAQSSWASSIFLATANTSAGTSACSVCGGGGKVWKRPSKKHGMGVTGELYGSTSATLQDLVLYNLAPGGALPYGGGFAVPGSDLYRKLLLYGSSNWNATVNETTGEPNPLPALGSVAYEDTLANLTLPLWYFARPANSDNGLMSLYRVVLVVPTAELQLWLYLLAQVSWYTNDTIALSYLGLPRNWVAYDTVITAVLPPGAPTPLLSYEPTYDPLVIVDDAAQNRIPAELSGRQEQLRITTVLGKGSFGVVYLGTWRGLRVAVKTLVVHDALLGTEGRRRQRAILEAAISTSLHHPNVVATYAFEVKPLGVVASSPPQNIVHGDLSSANILLTTIKPNVFGNLADTMAAGRSAGARSLAAAVSRLRGLWRPPVIAKVADFGLSVRMGEGQTHASNKFQGTPLYSAPEVLTRGRLTKAADVFSYARGAAHV